MISSETIITILAVVMIIFVLSITCYWDQIRTRYAYFTITLNSSYFEYMLGSDGQSYYNNNYPIRFYLSTELELIKACVSNALWKVIKIELHKQCKDYKKRKLLYESTHKLMTKDQLTDCRGALNESYVGIRCYIEDLKKKHCKIDKSIVEKITGNKVEEGWFDDSNRVACEEMKALVKNV